MKFFYYCFHPATLLINFLVIDSFPRGNETSLKPFIAFFIQWPVIFPTLENPNVNNLFLPQLGFALGLSTARKVISGLGGRHLFNFYSFVFFHRKFKNKLLKMKNLWVRSLKTKPSIGLFLIMDPIRKNNNNNNIQTRVTKL